MAEGSLASYPATLDTLYDRSSPLAERYEPISLTSAEALCCLSLPLAKRIFGQDPTQQDALSAVSSGDKSFTSFVAESVKSVLEDDVQGLSVDVKRSQLVHIGLAALFSFLQANVTGPPLEFVSPVVIFPSALRSTASDLRNVRDRVIRDLSVDGEAAYKLTPNVELFAVAKAILVDADVLVNDHCPLVAWVARMRVKFLHQKMLSEVTGTLQDDIYADMEDISGIVLSAPSSATIEEQSRVLLERATIHIHHGFDAKARSDLERAASIRGFEYALTGRLGKRTKFQDRDISQLVVLARSADDSSDQKTEKNYAPPGPKKLDLNDDTLLESISFAKEADQQPESKSVTVQDKSSLLPSLATLDPGDQPILDPVDSAILLALVSAITNTSPEDGLTREETLPYATRVLDGGSSNWQIYTQALLVRSRVEGYRFRTVERSVLQLQALVDQVIADTATADIGADTSSAEPTTFLPRPEKSESAPADQRLKYIWLLSFSTRWSLEAELAQRWVNLGGLRTALDIYERLQMWAEVALCYAATDREERAKTIVRRQLYEPTNKDREDDENERFEGPELSTLPADAPRLFCILGDIEMDPAMYEHAWEVSNKRYARAQRSLARHYLNLKPPALEKAEAAYQESLRINRLNHGAWFALGCVQLELQRWDDAIEAFTRTVQLDDTDAEAWSNLAAAMLRISDSESAEITTEIKLTKEPTEADSTEDNEPAHEHDPYKHKREALAALHRAAQLKHSDHRIWDNLLTVAASIPPPATPFRDVINAQRRVIEILGPKKGEKCIDLPILGMLVDHLVSNYEYEQLLIPADESAEAGKDGERAAVVVRSGTVPGQILSLLDDVVVPLITHSAPLWLLVARVEQFRGRPSKALEAHEKAWRAVVASSTQGAFQMGDEKKWMDVVSATERLVRGGYAKYGPMERERQISVSEGEGELVAKDWRFKARSAVRGILGKGKEFWEGSEGWDRLKELQVEVGGGSA